ncbi:hypothetical protein MKW92_016125, partial [Papaver armeniacum]
NVSGDDSDDGNGGDDEQEGDEGNNGGHEEEEDEGDDVFLGKDDGKQDVEHEEQNAKPKPVKRVKKDGTDISPSARHVPATHLMLEPLRSGKPRGEPRDGGKVLFGYSGSWAHTIYETI